MGRVKSLVQLSKPEISQFSELVKMKELQQF